MLSFETLRAANIQRLHQFKTRDGKPTYRDPLGRDWKLSTWNNAVLGELGEAANIIKKIEQGDYTLDQARNELEKELADVVTYLDILAFQAGIELGDAVRAKFNEVSERVGANVCIGMDDDWHQRWPTKESTVVCATCGGIGTHYPGCEAWKPSPISREEAIKAVERAGGLPNTPGTPGYDSGGFRPALEGGILKRKPNPGNDPAPRSSRSHGPTEESQDISGDYSGL